MTGHSYVALTDTSISELWRRAVRAAIQPAIRLAPLVVSLEMPSGTYDESTDVRESLDRVLVRKGLAKVHTVANTIFPEYMWRRSPDRHELYRRYRSVMPRVHRDRSNRYGTYFERLIAHPDGPGTTELNQLEHMFALHAAGVGRPGAYVLPVLSVGRDHTMQPRRGFPCLHTISLGRVPGTDELTLTALYTSQTLVGRAYGNYLGLVRLGRFLAQEMDRTLTRVTCVAANAWVDTPYRDIAGLLESQATST